jgi:hypothetical protein
MREAGFEPAHPEITELKPVVLDQNSTIRANLSLGINQKTFMFNLFLFMFMFISPPHPLITHTLFFGFYFESMNKISCVLCAQNQTNLKKMVQHHTLIQLHIYNRLYLYIGFYTHNHNTVKYIRRLIHNMNKVWPYRV